MAAGPHDAEEPDAGSRPPDDADPDRDGVPPGAPGEPEDADLDARWQEIVAELGGSPDPRAWVPDADAEEAENHFEPPDPGPVLGGDPLLTMAWSVVVGVPALLILAVVGWRDIPALLLQVAGVAFLAGVGLLVWRMPRNRDADDSGPGAVV